VSPDGGTSFDRFAAAVDPALLVVTAAANGTRAGCLVGFATQTSIAPRRYLVCLSELNHTTTVAAGSTHLAVHAVPREARWIAETFGGHTGEEVDKFTTVSWSPGPHDLPVLDDCPTRMVGRIVDRLPLGDHVGYVLAPEQAEASSATLPLRYADASDIEPGHPA